MLLFKTWFFNRLRKHDFLCQICCRKHDFFMTNLLPEALAKLLAVWTMLPARPARVTIRLTAAGILATHICYYVESHSTHSSVCVCLADACVWLLRSRLVFLSHLLSRYIKKIKKKPLSGSQPQVSSTSRSTRSRVPRPSSF
jgi:hypothetical protein